MIAVVVVAARTPNDIGEDRAVVVAVVVIVHDHDPSLSISSPPPPYPPVLPHPRLGPSELLLLLA